MKIELWNCLDLVNKKEKFNSLTRVLCEGESLFSKIQDTSQCFCGSSSTKVKQSQIEKDADSKWKQ